MATIAQYRHSWRKLVVTFLKTKNADNVFGPMTWALSNVKRIETFIVKCDI